MFFKRKKKFTTEPITTAVEVMPSEFFGGVNPVVQFKEKTVVSDANIPALTVVEKKALDKATAVGSGQKFHLANLLLNRKFMLMGAAGLFGVFAVAVSAYYFWPVIFSDKKQASSPPRVADNTVVPPSAPAVTTATVPVIPQPAEPAPEEISPLPTFADTKIVFPSVLLSDSADFDKDDITDVAEELFLTDPGVPDSDSDKYEDGHELFNLYNPNRQEPERLIDSGVVSEYVNPVFNYKLYYPSNWAVGSVDEQGRDVLFSTLTGENIEARVYDLAAGETLADWMAVFAPTETVQSLVDFSTAFKEPGKRRSDFLVYYFVHNQRVYVLAYHSAETEVINYRSVIKMMARSFSPGGAPAADLTSPIVEGAPTENSTTPIETTTVPAQE